MKAAYAVQIGKWSVKSSDDPKTELTRLEVFRSANGAGDFCALGLYAPPAPKPDLLAQAASAALDMIGLGGAAAEKPAFSVDVRGNALTYGDRITIDLTSGDRNATVMTAEVDAIRSTLEHTIVTGASGTRRLATSRLNRTFQNRTLGQIVGDLASAAQVDRGTIDAGSTYPYIVVDETQDLLTHVRSLARRESLDVWCTEENKLNVQTFSKTAADHELYYGIDLLSLEVTGSDAVADQIHVYGESPSSNLGSDTWHWIAKDLSPFRGEAGKGSRTAGMPDGALRTKDAAGASATATVGSWKDMGRIGRARLVGNPEIQIGDAIEIKNAPKTEHNGLFKVIAVHHVYDKRRGFTTTVHFSGQGGAKEAGDLLGQLGALAGGLGL